MRFAIEQLQSLQRWLARLERRLANLEAVEADANHTHTTHVNLTGAQSVGGAKTFTDATRIVSPSASTVPLRVDAAPGHTAALQEWRTSAGGLLASITPQGWLRLPGGALLRGNRVAIAASTILDFANVINMAAPNGILFVTDLSNARAGIVVVRAGTNAVTALAVTSGVSVTKDTATSINIYYEAAAPAGYKVQNTYTHARSVDFLLF